MSGEREDRQPLSPEALTLALNDSIHRDPISRRARCAQTVRSTRGIMVNGVQTFLEAWQGVEIPVGHCGGYIKVIDAMGDDHRIASTARIATGQKVDPARDRRLIRYLMRQDPPHTSPLEFAELHLEIKAPLDVWAQWVRHRTASINQRSMRANGAAIGLDLQHMAPAGDQGEVGGWRAQSTTNKMGSSGPLEHDKAQFANALEAEATSVALSAYEDLIGLGVAREQARRVLPQSAFTVANWKIDLNNLLRFLRQRTHSHAQAEIRAYAAEIAKLVQEWCPFVWEAFEDYTLNARRLSALEISALGRFLKGESIDSAAKAMKGATASERAALIEFLETLSGPKPPPEQPADQEREVGAALESLIVRFALPESAWVRHALSARVALADTPSLCPACGAESLAPAPTAQDALWGAEGLLLDVLVSVEQAALEIGGKTKKKRGELALSQEDAAKLRRVKALHRMVGDLLWDLQELPVKP